MVATDVAAATPVDVATEMVKVATSTAPFAGGAIIVAATTIPAGAVFTTATTAITATATMITVAAVAAATATTTATVTTITTTIITTIMTVVVAAIDNDAGDADAA